MNKNDENIEYDEMKWRKKVHTRKKKIVERLGTKKKRMKGMKEVGRLSYVKNHKIKVWDGMICWKNSQ